MSIYVFVKGVDDFGKLKISSKISIYEQHFPRSNKNDIHIYYYPKNPSVGIYQVYEETEFKIDHQEVWQYCKGKMKNLLMNDDVKGTINFFISHSDENISKLWRKIDDTIYDLQKKYNPELFKK